MFNSFKYAFRGISDALRSETNLRIHFLISIIVILFAIYFKFSMVEFAILFLIISLVIILEFINTTVEKLSDIVHPDKSEEVRIVKDISAGAVLIGAISSIVIGIFLFLPKL
ncbi:MAG TPA: diacylglycerol kinase family protein [Patescibacteria group bacterium]|nr:diacylglycerol kinase family protein [Patescibacteria group bacterium]